MPDRRCAHCFVEIGRDEETAHHSRTKKHDAPMMNYRDLREIPIDSNVAIRERMITYSVLRLAARRTDLTALIPFWESAPVSEKPVGLNRSPRRPGYGR
jgi:hypothetical protein